MIVIYFLGVLKFNVPDVGGTFCVYVILIFLQEKLLKPLGGYMGYSSEWRELAQVISRVRYICKLSQQHRLVLDQTF